MVLDNQGPNKSSAAIQSQATVSEFFSTTGCQYYVIGCRWPPHCPCSRTSWHWKNDSHRQLHSICCMHPKKRRDLACSTVKCRRQEYCREADQMQFFGLETPSFQRFSFWMVCFHLIKFTYIYHLSGMNIYTPKFLKTLFALINLTLHQANPSSKGFRLSYALWACFPIPRSQNLHEKFLLELWSLMRPVKLKLVIMLRSFPNSKRHFEKHASLVMINNVSLFFCHAKIVL